MARRKSSPDSKKFPLIPVLVAVVAIGIVITVSGFTFAASQESHDPFCSSCHTQPESTFYQRSTSSSTVDLASFHQPQKVRCIDCHSGQGIPGRVSAELMGARNAIKWYTGTAVQPAVLTFPIGNGNCLKCHQDVTQQNFSPKEQIDITALGGSGGRGERGRANHWHQFLARWQAASPTAKTCVSCHAGHTTGGTTQTGFMDSATVQGVCNDCHQVLRREGEGG